MESGEPVHMHLYGWRLRSDSSLLTLTWSGNAIQLSFIATSLLWLTVVNDSCALGALLERLRHLSMTVDPFCR